VQRLRSLTLRRPAARRPSLLAVEAYGDPVPTDRYAELGARPPVSAGVVPLTAPAVAGRTLAAAS
jgi:hypothetical protein